MPHECTTCGRTFPDGSKEMLSGCPDCGGNKFQFAPAGRARSGSSDTAQATAETTRSAATDTGQSTTGTAGSGAAESTGTVERAAETVRDWVSSDSDTEASAEAADATADRPERSWPSSDTEPDTDASTGIDSDGFAEWPETARRPEDRSTPPADDSDAASASTPTETVSDRSSAAADRSATGEDRSIMADSENSAQADARSEVVTADDLPAGADRDAAADASSRTGGATDDAGDRPPEHGRVVSEPSGETPSIEELRAELNEQFESIKIVSPGQYELNLMELYNREEYIISLQEDGRYVIDVPDSWRADED